MVEDGLSNIIPRGEHRNGEVERSESEGGHSE